MQMVLMIGLQGSGKSSFCRQQFYDSHVRINLDMLRTRNRERILVEACFAAKQRFVVDNTNLTPDLRAAYIQAAQQAKFEVVGYFMQSRLQDCLARNAQRSSGRIPDKAVIAASNRMLMPSKSEGFDKLYFVRIQQNEFLVEEWRDGI
jgi:predicted kinase